MTPITQEQVEAFEHAHKSLSSTLMAIYNTYALLYNMQKHDAVATSCKKINRTLLEQAQQQLSILAGIISPPTIIVPLSSSDETPTLPGE